MIVLCVFWEYGGFNVCFSREDLSCFDAVVCFNGVFSDDLRGISSVFVDVRDSDSEFIGFADVLVRIVRVDFGFDFKVVGYPFDGRFGVVRCVFDAIEGQNCV